MAGPLQLHFARGLPLLLLLAASLLACVFCLCVFLHVCELRAAHLAKLLYIASCDTLCQDML